MYITFWEAVVLWVLTWRLIFSSLMPQRFQHDFKSPLLSLFWWGPSAAKESNSHNCFILFSFSWVYFLKVEKPCCWTHWLVSGHVRGHWQARGSTAFGSGLPSWPMGCVREYRIVIGRGHSCPRPIRCTAQTLNHTGGTGGLASIPTPPLAVWAWAII